MCEGDGCNKIDKYSESRGFKCYVCNSATDEYCDLYPDMYHTKVCPITPNSFNEGPGCFVHRHKDGSIVRDCLTSAKRLKIDLDECNKNVENKGKSCILCNSDSCNARDAPGSAASIKVYGSLMVLPLLFVVKYL